MGKFRINQQPGRCHYCFRIQRDLVARCNFAVLREGLWKVSVFIRHFYNMCVGLGEIISKCDDQWKSWGGIYVMSHSRGSLIYFSIASISEVTHQSSQQNMQFCLRQDSSLATWFHTTILPMFSPVFPADDIIERQIEEGMISPELREKISFVLLRKHRHQTKKPIHRSLADIGKSNSASEFPVWK